MDNTGSDIHDDAKNKVPPPSEASILTEGMDNGRAQDRKGDLGGQHRSVGLTAQVIGDQLAIDHGTRELSGGCYSIDVLVPLS